MEIILKIQGTEGLEKAILQLAQTLSGDNSAITHTVTQPSPLAPAQPSFQPAQQPPVQTYQPPAQQYQQPVTTQYQSPAQAPAQQFPMNSPAMQQPPVQQAPVQQVPTSHTPQAYTQDQLAVAMTAMCDAGKVDTIMGILAQFGAETLMQVPKDMYPTLATMLRGAGANI